MEQWLANNWWLIGTLVVLSAIAFKRIDYLEKTQTDHLDSKNPAPHPNCPVHSAQFIEQGETLKRIDSRLEKMDNRFYSFMRSNGYQERAGDE